jgi:hypothetical protein
MNQPSSAQLIAPPEAENANPPIELIAPPSANVLQTATATDGAPHEVLDWDHDRYYVHHGGINE